MQKLRDCLLGWGLSPNEAKVYSALVYCTKPLAAPQIARLADVRRTETYRALAGLEAKGLTFRIIGSPTKFQALDLEKGLKVFIKQREESLADIKRMKDELVRELREQRAESFPFESSKQLKIIKGQRNIARFIEEILFRAGSANCDAIGVVADSSDDYVYSILREMAQHKKPKTGKIRILTSVMDRNKDWVRRAAEVAKIRHIVSPPNTMFVNSENEMIQSFTSGEHSELEVAIWTESRQVVLGARQMLENLWNSSSDLESRLLELEKGIPIEQFRIVRSRREILDEIAKANAGAVQELAILTSPSILRTGRGVFDPAISEARARGVTVRMIGFIDKTNLGSARRLMESVELRHYPVDPLFTIGISDDAHAVLANWRPDRFDVQEEEARDIAFSTNLSENVRGLRDIFESMWKHAQRAEDRIRELEVVSGAVDGQYMRF